MAGSGSAQESMQKFGRALSAMVMPNIGAFIAWGLMIALFIPVGWMPNEYLAQVPAPMAKWLIPLLIGFAGGNMIYGQRGGVVGAIATSGAISGADIPMFLGAMIMGPFGGWVIKKFDEAVQDSIPTGFEMLVNNFSAGILGAILAMLAYAVTGPVVTAMNGILREGVDALISTGFLPLASILIEPAKVLFLNNAINHGVLTPIATQQAQELGKSMLFLLEANPGPGFGVLLAYAFFGTGSAKASSPGAMIIHVLGGIHEIYFPYILMKPSLILAVIAGGAAGVFTLTLFDGGLSGPAAPGSILAVLAMTPSGCFFANIADFLVATTVSGVIASVILKSSPVGEDLESAQAQMKDMKSKSKGEAGVQGEVEVAGAELRKIIYACDAGMGSSALGAAALRKKLKKDGITHITVANTAIGNIPSDAQIVVSHEKLKARAIADSPQAEHIFVQDFTNNNVYEIISARLSGVDASNAAPAADNPADQVKEGVLKKENIFLGVNGLTKEEVIRKAGEALVAAGYVEERYVEGMLARERDLSTYIGNGIAIPHGENAVKDAVKQSGIVVIQSPEGIEFADGSKAHIIVGIAGKDNDHLAILANIASAIEDYDDAKMRELYTTTDANLLYELFTKND